MCQWSVLSLLKAIASSVTKIAGRGRKWRAESNSKPRHG
jgi:hypothetical protein